MATLAVSHFTIAHDTEAAETITEMFNRPSDDPKGGVQRLSTFLDGALCGAKNCYVQAYVEGGATSDDFAAGTVAITHANVVANDTLAIAGNTFTWVASAANENQITIGASATADGDALVAALAAHSVVKNFVTGVNAAGTVTITSRVPGYTGKMMLMATSKPTAFALTQPVLTAPTIPLTIRTWRLGA